VSYTAADGRAQVLAELAAATGAIGAALTELGEAYELVDEQSGDRLEAELFGPVQRAYARAQRTHREFAEAHGAPTVEFTAPAHGAGRPGDARGALERAAAGLELADATLATLQDSMLPVEVGDPALRGGIAGVRELIAPLPASTRGLLRVLGR
jgi:hypothetical protein